VQWSECTCINQLIDIRAAVRSILMNTVYTVDIINVSRNCIRFSDTRHSLRLISSPTRWDVVRAELWHVQRDVMDTVSTVSNRLVG